MQKSELARRAAALQEKMGQLGLDGVLAAQNMSMYYLSGTMQCQYVYVPAAGESFGLVRKNLARAEAEAGIPVVPINGFSDMGAAIAARGTPRRLGVEMDVLPAEIFFRLQKVFPQSELLNAAPAIREVRQVKSAYELEQFRLAAQQVDTLYRQIPQLLEIGKEEVVFAAECEAVLRSLGHQGISRMRRFNSEMYYGH
ncbi:MAG TPA: aminopeptidase P family protein, partial [Firmicutes bacterium]|nr:aminopeptidase P family protein [Bacillota bacterium]